MNNVKCPKCGSEKLQKQVYDNDNKICSNCRYCFNINNPEKGKYYHEIRKEGSVWTN
jgi:acetyl-CoA carboxylase beta subunit